MGRMFWIRTGLLLAWTAVLGVAGMSAWRGGLMPAASAQERRGQPPPTLESLSADVAQLKALVPSNSHIMMDVQFQWMNLWFAARQRNWPLAQYFYNEARGHMRWLITKSPTTRAPDGTDVDLKSIFEAIDTSSLAGVKDAIDKKNSVQFAAAYKTMLKSCYSCHKSAGRPYIRPAIPLPGSISMINFNPNATWPQ